MKDYHQIALFHRTLAELCRTGMPMGKAFRTLADDLRGPLRTAAESMEREVEKGEPLADVYARHGKMFPETYGALVEAGIQSGDLPGTLEEISRHAFLRADVRSKIRRTLALPLVTIVAAVCLAAFLLAAVVPQFGMIFSQVTDKRGNPLELPAITKMALALSNFTVNSGALLLVAVVAAIIGVCLWTRTAAGASVWDRIALRMPFLPALAMSVNASTAMFASVAAALLRRGLPLDRALAVAADGTDSPTVRREVQAMAARAASGAGLADAAREGRLLPSSFVWLLSTSESRGAPVEALEDIATIYRDRVDRAHESVAWVIVPILTVGTGFGVGFIILSVFYPILVLQSALM